MPIHLLFNTTITIKSSSRTETNKQPVETIGSAGSAIPARKEHIEDIPMPMGPGLVVQSVYLFYVPAGTTIKERDVVTESSEDYRVLSVTNAYGMGAIDHIEFRAVKLP